MSTPTFDSYNNQPRFRRPDKGIHGLLSRPMGALQPNARLVDLSSPKFDDLPDYKLAGFLLVTVIVGMLVALAFFAPLLAISPMLLIGKAIVPLLGNGIGGFMTLILTIRLAVFFARENPTPTYYGGRPLDQAAAYEEQWFRMGSESWSLRQRAYSCLAFGFAHVTNMYYPLVSLLILPFAGAALMALYLKEYRRSGDRERAVLAATKLHAAYNRFAMLYIALVAVALVAYFAISRLL